MKIRAKYLGASYVAKLKAVREADKKHDEKMTEIAARGGITLEQLRGKSKHDKAAFFAKYGDKVWKKKNVDN